jgi:hypothetical protein
MLNPATTYYARVKGTNSTSESDYSNIIEVTTLPSNDVNVATISPFNPIIQSIETTSTFITINIEKPEDREKVTEYKLTVSAVSDFSTTIVDKLVYVVDENTVISTSDFIPYISLTFGNLSPATTYYCKLQAANSIGLSGEVTFNPVTRTANIPPEIIGVTALSATDADITWYPVPGATSYRLDVSTDANFSSLVLNNTTVSGTTYTVASLVELTPYYYRLRSFNGTVVSNNSPTYSFTTLDDVATYSGVAINIETPTILRTKVLDTSITVNWKSVEFATGYYVEVATNSAFTTPFLQQSLTANTITIPSLTAETTYYFRVRASNSYMTTAYVNTSITTLKVESALTVPQALTPFNIYSTGFIFNWVKRSYATSYVIDISTSTTFSTITQRIFTGDIDSIIIEGLAANTTYYVRVFGANTTLISNASAYVTVVTTTALPDITGLSSTVTENKAVLNWTTSGSYVDYELSVFKSVDGTTLVPLNSSLFSNRSVGTTGTFTVDILLEPDTLYKWQIEGITSSGDSKESSIEEFTTLKKGAFLQLDYIKGSVKWTGELNRIEASTDSDFKNTIPLWTNRTPITAQEAGLYQLLDSSKHFYIRGRHQTGPTYSKYSNSIYTLTDSPIIKPPVITPTSIKVRWKHGNAETYLIQVERFVSSAYEFLPGYLIPVDIGIVDEFLLSSLVADNQYRITLYYRIGNKNIKLLQSLVYKTYKYANAFSLTLNNAITSPMFTSIVNADVIRLTFSSVETRIAYRISKSVAFLKLVEYKETETMTTDILVEPNTEYRIEVVSINSAGERSAVVSGTFTTPSLVYNSSSINTIPTLGAPIILNSSEVRVNWNTIANATDYKIEVSESSTFPVLSGDVSVTYYTSTTGKYAIISGLLNTKQYYGRLYAYSNYSVSKYSNSVLIDTSP